MNDNKDKFKFVNKKQDEQPKEDFLLEDDQEEDKEQSVQREELIEKRYKKFRQSRLFKIMVIIIIDILLTALFFGIGLLWQKKINYLSICNAFWVAFAIKLTYSWGMWVYNLNILSPIIHGTKTFFLMFVGKKPKEDYYTYTQKIKEHPIPKVYYILSFISAGSLLIVCIGLTIGFYYI